MTQPCFDGEDVAAMEAAARQCAVTQGPVTANFETAFSQRFGFAGAIATNSCTSALILALRLLNVRAGLEVILPSYTCLAVLNAVIQSGASPVLVDNHYAPERMDYNIDPDAVKAKITPKTAAIIVPHMFGVPADVKAIVAFGVPVIEDVTLSLGAFYEGRVVGVWGAMCVCSFHASKMIACGEGGMLASASSETIIRGRYLNGWEGEQADLRLEPGKLPDYELRYNFHLSDMASALGISQLGKLDAFIAHRKILAARYTKRMQKLGTITCPTQSKSNIFFRYLISLDRTDPIEYIKRFASAGIEVGRGVYPPLHRYLKREWQKYPGAERAVSTLLSIPLYPALTEEGVAHILDTSERLLGGV